MFPLGEDREWFTFGVLGTSYGLGSTRPIHVALEAPTHHSFVATVVYGRHHVVIVVEYNLASYRNRQPTGPRYFKQGTPIEFLRGTDSDYSIGTIISSICIYITPIRFRELYTHIGGVSLSTLGCV